MAQFTIYKSTDGSAPTVSGTVGDLVNLLDKCLVTGYGAKAAAGWTKPYTGTNKAAFRSLATGTGIGCYLRVDDNGPGAGTAKEARVVGYETMSDVDTGTGPFPTVAQFANGLFVRKSVAADATTRAWVVVADSRTVYVFILSGDTANSYKAFGFGEFYSLLASDSYRAFICARTVENNGTANNDRLDLMNQVLNSPDNIYLARGHTGVLGAISAGRHSDYTKAGGSSFLAGLVPFTNPSDGGLYLSPVWISDPTTAPASGIRGRLRGFWAFLHPIVSVNDLDTVSGTGDLAGKSFLFVKQSGSLGLYTLETSATLETN